MDRKILKLITKNEVIKINFRILKLITEDV